jgi:hypothetical protein
LRLGFVHARLDLLGILQIVALEVDLGGEDLALLVVNTLDFHLQTPDSGQPWPTVSCGH